MQDTRTTSHFNINLGPHATAHDAGVPVGVPTAGHMLPAVSEELAGIKGRLGFLNGMAVDRRISQEAKKILGEAYVQILEAKRQELTAKITIGLSEAKKKLLVESLRVGGEIDKEIAELSAQFSSTMFNGTIAANFAAAQEEKKRLEELDAAYKAGNLAEPRYRQLRETTIEACDHVIGILKSNVSQIIQGHVGQIKLALDMFRERVLAKGF